MGVGATVRLSGMGMDVSNTIELREQYAALVAKGDALAKASRESGLTDDEAREFDRIAAEATDVKMRLEVAEKRDAQAAEMEAAHAAMQRSAGRATAQAVSRTERETPASDWGRRFVESPEFKAASVRGGLTGRENAVNVGSFHTRTLIYSGALATDQVQDQYLPGIVRGNDVALRVRDVLLSATTTSDAITWIKENAFTNAAAEVAESTSLSATAKPESALTFTQDTASVVTIAHWIPVTRQALADAGQLSAYINDRLVYGLRKREDNQLLNGAGGGTDLTGLLNTSGVQALDSTHFSGAPVANAGTANENFNRVHRAITKIMTTGAANPTFIIMNPADVEKFSTYADGSRQYLAGGPYATQPARIWGLPIVMSEQIAAGTALVGDGSQAAVFDREAATIYTTDSHGDLFIRNIIVVLAEERVALAVFRAAAFAKLSLV